MPVKRRGGRNLRSEWRRTKGETDEKRGRKRGNEKEKVRYTLIRR
jgi:hypothetical protein